MYVTQARIRKEERLLEDKHIQQRMSIFRLLLLKNESDDNDEERRAMLKKLQQSAAMVVTNEDALNFLESEQVLDFLQQQV